MNRRVSRLALGAALLASALVVSGASNSPPVVIDINTALIIEGSVSHSLGTLGQWTLFAANGLWRTDGTVPGTQRIHQSQFFRVGGSLVTLNGLGYFVARDAQHPWGLWVTDATAAGTRWLMDMGTGVTGDPPRLLGLLNGRLVVSGYADGSHQDVLLLMDGTPAGTVELVDRNVGDEDLFAFHGGKLYFISSKKTIFDQIAEDPWVTDGTIAGTRQIPLGAPFKFAADFMVAGDRIVFSALDTNGWRRLLSIDTATDVGAFLNATVGLQQGQDEYPAPTVVQNIVLFAGSSNESSSRGDAELWRTDGTPAGTSRVVDLTPGPQATPFSANFLSVGTRAVFTIDGKIWSSDGTAAQTFSLNAPDTYLRGGVAGDFAYFQQYGVGPTVRTDGTVGGTQLLADMVTAPGTFQVVGDSTAAYIWTHTKLMRHQPGISRTDVLVTDPVGEILTRIDDRLLFSLQTPATGSEPWITDGTPAGTQLLVDANPMPDHNDSSAPRQLVDVAGTLYFIASRGITTVWRSNGTLAGTLELDPTMAHVEELQAVDDVLFFRSSTAVGAGPLTPRYWSQRPGEAVRELTSDAYNAAIRRVRFRGATYSLCRPSTSVFDTLCKADSSGAFQPVSGMPNDAADTNRKVVELHAVGDRLYLVISVFGRATLWISDGTGPGTRRVGLASGPLVDVQHVTPAAGHLYFTADRSSNGTAPGIFRCDDASELATDMNGPPGNRFVRTNTGVFITSLQDLTTTFYPDDPAAVTDPLTRAVDDIVVLDGGAQVVLQTTGPDNLELWISDGRVANTQKVFDFARVLYADLSHFFDFNGRPTFFANARSGMLEIWETDGSSAGTLLRAQTEASDPQEPVVSRRKLFFAANGAAVGYELFVLTDPSAVNAAPIAVADDGIGVDGGATVLIDVLANDDDADGGLDPASVRIVRQPSLGSVQVATTGRISYTARSGESGGDSFSYVVADDEQADSNVATVSVTIRHPPSAPPASGGNSGGGGSMRTVDVLAGLLACLRILSRRRRTGRRFLPQPDTCC